MKPKRSTKPSGESKYGRKIRGDYPEHSPYRTRWANYVPFGFRRGVKAKEKRSEG